MSNSFYTLQTEGHHTVKPLLLLLPVHLVAGERSGFLFIVRQLEDVHSPNGYQEKVKLTVTANSHAALTMPSMVLNTLYSDH